MPTTPTIASLPKRRRPLTVPPMMSSPNIPPKVKPLGALQKQLIRFLAELAVKEFLEHDTRSETVCESEEVCHARR